MPNKNWGIKAVCIGMLAGRLCEVWVKNTNGRRFRGTEVEAKIEAKKMNDSLSLPSRINISYYAESMTPQPCMTE